MISHDRAQELISARMDAPLAEAEHHALQSHLATCTACRAFVMQADEIARDLQVLPLLAASPAVSRSVMAAIRQDSANAGWGWLRHALQALSSPGMAVASSMALVVALAGALFLALNAPGGNNPGSDVTPEGTIAALAPKPLPTEAPTEPPAPTQAPAVQEENEEEPAEPTATKAAGRAIEPPPTEAPETPTPEPTPTATSVPIQVSSGPDQPPVESPPIQPAQETAQEEAPVLGMAPDEAPAAAPTADLAQAAEPAVAPADTGEVIEEPVASEGEAAEPAPAEGQGEAAPETASAPEGDQSGQKDNRRKDESEKTSEEPPAEPQPTRPVGPLPPEAIAALDGVDMMPDVSLPPAPLDPTQPDQSFLPVTPTPVTDGTPTPEAEQATESEAPQLADEWSGDLGVAALAPEAPVDQEPVVAEAPDETTKDSKKVKNKEKRDKDSDAGKSREQEQSAYVESPMAWSTESIDLGDGAGQPVELQQTTGEPAAPAPEQTTQYPTDASSTSGETAVTDPAVTATPEPQIDPISGMQIDPATGYLIDPTTGYLLDREHGRVIDPRTGYEVHPGTGLLIDPATGAQLDPNTLEVVIPPGFGTDTPAYNPGSPEMRGSIETVVDDTYNNASIRMEPATDGPVQPIGEIVVPTESGDAVEIS